MQELRDCSGEVTEWLKVHDWKSCVRDERTEGSNPSLSASSAHSGEFRRYTL